MKFMNRPQITFQIKETIPQAMAVFPLKIEKLKTAIALDRKANMTVQTLDHYIVKTKGVVGSKPRIAGRRIAVQNIVIWHEWIGLSADEIANEYDLTLAEIYAALAYYYTNPQEIDDAIKRSEAFVAEMKKKIPSKVSFQFNESD